MIKDGKEIVLSREQAIKEHRAMWNWIADHAKTIIGTPTFLTSCCNLKAIYLGLYNYGDILNNCFCCDYCPLKWVEEVSEVDRPSCCRPNSPYNLFTRALIEDDIEEVIKSAKDIANLPEKELEE